jgi:hypothetical protein
MYSCLSTEEEEKIQTRNDDMKIEEAQRRVYSLVHRWNSTPEWHSPEFLEGQIHITTGDLLALKIVLEHVKYGASETSTE